MQFWMGRSTITNVKNSGTFHCHVWLPKGIWKRQKREIDCPHHSNLGVLMERWFQLWGHLKNRLAVAYVWQDMGFQWISCNFHLEKLDDDTPVDQCTWIFQAVLASPFTVVFILPSCQNQHRCAKAHISRSFFKGKNGFYTKKITGGVFRHRHTKSARTRRDRTSVRTQHRETGASKSLDVFRLGGLIHVDPAGIQRDFLGFELTTSRHKALGIRLDMSEVRLQIFSRGFFWWTKLGGIFCE